MNKLLLLILPAVVMFGCQESSTRQTTSSQSAVRVAGAMRNVMWKGQLGGVISLDSLTEPGWYGLGPLAYLRGELLLMDGVPYVSVVESDSTMSVRESDSAQAPFFVYAKATDWQAMSLPDSVHDIPTLEHWLDAITADRPRPFVFRLAGMVDAVEIHIQNLPPGTRVSSPQEAHLGQTNYPLTSQEVDIVGFFSTEHQGVFTHHDSFVHLHLITADKSQMGHLDRVEFSAGKVKVYLPE